MTRYTSPALKDWPLPIVRFACTDCGRAGQYRKEHLIEQLGADVVLQDLRELVAECPRRKQIDGRCGVYYVDLVPRER
jgi:hypothetical protein